MAHKVTASDLWRGFSRDKVVRFQRDLITPCQMTKSFESSESNTEPIDHREKFNMICSQYYQMTCNCLLSWSGILLVHYRKAVTFLSLVAIKSFHRAGYMMEKVKQVVTILYLLATRAIQWRSEMWQTLKRTILSRAISLEQHQVKKILSKILDRTAGQLREKLLKFHKRALYFVNYKTVMFLGVAAVQALLVYYLHKSHSSSNIKECQRDRQLPDHHMPSAWYYEHVHYYPHPQMTMLTAEDGAPPIWSQLSVNSREITIATHTTMDRFPAVEMIAFRWSGPMVLVVLVRTVSEVASAYSALEDLHSRVEAEGRCRLNIQMVREEGFKNDDQALQALYPINSMRNLALNMVTTQLVFMIDADFVPNPGLHEHLTQHEEKFMDLLKKTAEWRQLLVVPAFQLSEDKSIQYQHSLHVLPHTKEELREAWWNGIVDCFQCDTSPDSHQPTEYYKFTDPAVTWPYQAWYKEGYEPFYIASTKNLPKFDSRFRGHGKNKISHTYLLSLKGFTFWVIPEGFLVELPHPPSLSEKRKVQDPLQSCRIDGIFNRFMSEVNWIYNITTVSKDSETKKETLC